MSFSDQYMIHKGSMDEGIKESIARDYMDFFSKDYQFLYYHDLEKDLYDYRLIRDPEIETMFSIMKKHDDFLEGFQECVKTFVHPEDVPNVIGVVQADNIREILAHNTSATFHYRRLYADGDYQYYKIVISKLEELHEEPRRIIVAGMDIDNEARAELFRREQDKRYATGIDALSREYMSVYYINMDTGEQHPYKVSNRLVSVFGEQLFRGDFDTAITYFLEKEAHPDERERMAKVLTREYIKDKLKKQDSFTETYLNRDDSYCELKFSRIEQADESLVVVLGIAVKDEEIRTRMNHKKQKDFQLALLDGMSREYYTVWLVHANRTLELYRSTEDAYERQIVKMFTDIGDYSYAMQEFVDRYVAPADKSRVEKETDFDSLLSRIPEHDIYTVTFRQVQEHGQLKYTQICFSRAKGAYDQMHIVMSFRDVNESIREEIRQQERYQKAVKERDMDGLTGIRNRHCYERRLKELRKSKNQTVSCVFIDVDGLRDLNNTEGHFAGDELIKFVSKTMVHLWTDENAFRIGGDEFVVFLFDQDEEKLEKEIKTFEETLTKQHYSASVGHATAAVKGLVVTDLISAAEEGMYEKKRIHYSGANDRRKPRQKK